MYDQKYLSRIPRSCSVQLIVLCVNRQKDRQTGEQAQRWPAHKSLYYVLSLQQHSSPLQLRSYDANRDVRNSLMAASLACRSEGYRPVCTLCTGAKMGARWGTSLSPQTPTRKANNICTTSCLTLLVVRIIGVDDAMVDLQSVGYR